MCVGRDGWMDEETHYAAGWTWGDKNKMQTRHYEVLKGRVSLHPPSLGYWANHSAELLCHYVISTKHQSFK